ncbi:MAG: YqgE/AlgH family protein [Bacteroides sp.]|nr:YqgE/AlgH family protein [Bacteroides sp.]MBD5337005.1 YqgE/AlgH family protein [Bacteroides sp.]
MEYNEEKKPENLGHDIEIRRGDLLLANPFLKQPDFYRSAVLILEKDANGGFLGLTLNKPTRLLMQDLFDLPEEALDVEVYSGGPVDENRLFMLHRLGSEKVEGSIEIANGIFVGGQLTDIARAVTGGAALTGDMRFFIGYAGWAKGQLEDEIEGNFWAISRDYDPALLLTGSGPDYWREEVTNLGDRYRSWLMIPENPSDN